MGRYIGAKCRLCRREGIKLFLKGARCSTSRCAIEVRNYPPGQHQQKKMTEYGMQLREKQKLRRMYGLYERPFRNYFHKASMQKGVTGEIMLSLIETRLDNVAYLLGFAPSRDAARQLICHGHVTVNGKKLDIPSYNVKVGNVIGIRDKEKSKKLVSEWINTIESKTVPTWLKLDDKALKAEVLRIPTREEIQVPVNENTIVELYSK